MSDNVLPMIADRVINRPLMIYPEKLALVASILENRIEINASNLREIASTAQEDGKLPLPEASRFVGTFELNDPNDPRSGRKPYRTTKDGVAIIPLIGSLVNRGGFFEAMSGIQSYEKFKRDIGAAAADAAVSSIIVDVDSPGGEAVGAFEAGDAVAAAAAAKDVIAVAGGLCCSAAYAAVCQATRVVISPSSLMGSIGVVLLHLDHSNRLHNAGVVPTLIHAGARKTDGTPYKPLTDDVKSELRQEVEQFMNLFVAGVAKGRPGLTEEAIRATEARTFMGAQAVAVGLADSVGTFESVLAELSTGATGRNNKRPPAVQPGKVRTMTDKTYSQADLDKAVAEAKTEATAAGHTAGHKAGVAEGLKSANDRFAAVIASEHFAGREATALQMLTTTDMSAETLFGVLATVPKGAAAAPAPKLPSGRAADAKGGLATAQPGADAQVDPVQGEGDKPDTRSDFEKGKSRVPAALRKTSAA